MPTEDEFVAMLGSLDDGQLKELELELQNRSRTRNFAFNDPREGSKAPTISPGAFASPQEWSEYMGEGGFWGNFDEDLIKKGFKEASVYQQYKNYGRRKSEKKKKKAYDKSLRDEALRQKQLLGERLRQVQGQRKTVGMRNQVDQQFRDLNLEGLFDRVVKGNLDSSLIGITEQHDDLTRQSGFDAVRSGLGGSSVDAERIADVQSSQEQAMAQAASQAQMQRTQLGQQADTARRNLLSSVSGSNPGEQARLSGEIANLQNSANAGTMNAGLGQFGMQQNQQQLAGQSQAIGGLLSNYANLYNTQNSR